MKRVEVNLCRSLIVIIKSCGTIITETCTNFLFKFAFILNNDQNKRIPLFYRS